MIHFRFSIHKFIQQTHQEKNKNEKQLALRLTVKNKFFALKCFMNSDRVVLNKKGCKSLHNY